MLKLGFQLGVRLDAKAGVLKLIVKSFKIVCVYVHVCGVRPEEGGIYVSGMELHMGVSYPVCMLELNQGPLQEQQVFLAAEPPLQP